MPFYSARHLCPNCGKPIRGEDTRCQSCGGELEPHRSKRPLPPGVNAHRSGKIIMLSVVSLLLLPITCVGLSFAGYLMTTGWWVAWMYLAIGIVGLAIGQVFGVVAGVWAFRDWTGMGRGRVDRAGLGRTVFGGIGGGLMVLLYWAVIGCVIVSLL